MKVLCKVFYEVYIREGVLQGLEDCIIWATGYPIRYTRYIWYIRVFYKVFPYFV